VCKNVKELSGVCRTVVVQPPESRNPQTGKPIKIPGKAVVKFRLAKAFKKGVVSRKKKCPPWRPTLGGRKALKPVFRPQHRCQYANGIHAIAFEATRTLNCCNWSRGRVCMEHAYGRRYDSTWHAYDGRMTTPLLRCAPLATPRGRCCGIHDEHQRRGAGNGSPFSFLAQEFQPRACEPRVIGLPVNPS